MKKRYPDLMLIVVLTAIVLMITMAAVPLVTAGQKVNLNQLELSEGAGRLPTAKVAIDKKTLEAVITNIGERYALSKETIITGLDGQQVSIRKMLVPCDAEITWETRKGVRTAQRIKMVRIGKDASWQWGSERPD